MFKAHYLQKSCRSLSMKCDVSLDELEKEAQAPEKTEVELQKDMVWCQWKSYPISDVLWHVHDAWKEVTESCIRGESKKLCPELGVDLSERLLEERLKLTRRVGIELKAEDVNFLLETIVEELSTNWRSSSVSWRRRWRLSSILRCHRRSS